MAKKILVVDDEENVCTFVKELLAGTGFSVSVAHDGDEALKRLRRSPKVDLVLIDFFMPRMNGRELAEQIRKEPALKGLTLAFLTVVQFGKIGYKEMEKLRIADYIQKPFDNDDFLKRVRKLVQ